MDKAVFDASAVLAIAFNEPGADKAIGHIHGGAISAVNYSESGAKLIDKGMEPKEAFRWLAALRLEVVAFDGEQAMNAAALRRSTKARRLSFADRACIAMAAGRNLRALTTDRAWADLELPCAVELIR